MFSVARRKVFAGVHELRNRSQIVVRAQELSSSLSTEESIDDLASAFSTNKVSIVRRLPTLGLTDQAFYGTKETEYANNYAAYLEHKKASYADREFGGRNMPNEAFSLLGRNFVRTVLAPYHSDRIKLRDVSEYLYLKSLNENSAASPRC